MKISKYLIIGLCCLILTFSFGCTKNKGPDLTRSEAPETEKAPPQKIVPDLSPPEGFERKFHRTFSILMPTEWREIEYSNMIFYLPPGSEAVDPISEKVQVIAAGLPKENRLPLKNILEDGIDDSKKLIPDLIMTKEEEITLGNNYAVRMVFTGTIQGKKFENIQISTINKDIMLHIVYNCFEDNCKYSDIYNKMVDSFEILQDTKEG